MARLSNRILILLTVMGWIILPVFQASLAATTITVDAGRGDVTVQVPTVYDPEVPVPLLIMLHGLGLSGQQAENGFFFLRNHADAYRYIYTYPDGRLRGLDPPNDYRYWDATDFCCDVESPNGDEDSDYLRDLIEAIEEVLNVNPQRIYILGHSNGGSMAYRMACDHSEKIAGVISFAGPMYNPENADDNPLNGEDFCQPTQPVHVLHIHGTEDPQAPYEGGAMDWPGTSLDGLPFPGAQTAVDTWSHLNMCRPDVPQAAGTLDLWTGGAVNETTLTRYPSECHVASSTELWTVDGGGHSPQLTNTFRNFFFNYLNSHPKQETRFVDNETISWPPMVSAIRYEMYRGAIGDLVDGNDDGLPDQEYGDCVSGSDPDLTDTEYADTEEPLPGEGFFYNMSYVDNLPPPPFGQGGNEGGLGKTSDGRHRVNSVQCP